MMKAYRNRAKENVLPYPSKSGLFSRVKRYFSGSSVPNNQQHEQTRRPTQMADAVTNRSEFTLPESSTPSNNTLLEADQSTNRVLSNFFQEKGDRPLSQIEYEGVMSLLEKSKASITLPIPESTPRKEKPQEGDASNASIVQHNQTFAPYTQNMLRNTSMYEGNSTSFVTPDYKPIYHTFADTSRGNISVKRVYQFSGLPSPYRTRIKAPNMAARRARRLESLNAVTSNVASTPSSTASVSAVDPASPKVMSNTANSLLSILDGTDANPETEASEVSRPLHNPYAKYKRKSTSVDSRAPKRNALGADDIAKTMSFNTAEEVPAALEEKKKSSVSVDATTTPLFDKSASVFTVDKPDQDSNNSLGKSSIALQSKVSANTNSTVSGELAKPHMHVTSIANGVAPSKSETSSLKTKVVSESSAAPQSTPAFSFGSFKSAETTAPISNGFKFGAKVSAAAQDNIEKVAPKQDEPKKTFSFGLPAQASNSPDSLPEKNQAAPAFSTGAREGGVSTTPGGFSFGQAPVAVKQGTSGTNGSAISNNGNKFEFHFPPVETINSRVDEAKVEQYKLMFEF